MQRRWPAVLLVSCLSASVLAAETEDTLVRSRSVETAALNLLAEHFRFEESLLSSDNDRIMVFLSVPHGARMIMEQVILRINDKPVLTYAFDGIQLLSFQRRSVQLLYAGRLAPGDYRLRLDVKTGQGTVLPMKDFTFTKEDIAKFIDIQLVGYNVREIYAVDW